MAFTIVPHVATGDLYTAANYNTYVSDNFAASVPDMFTAAGQIFQATGADAGAVLSLGTSIWQRLRPNAGLTAIEWSNIGQIIPARLTAQVDATTTSLANITDFVQAIGASETWFFLWCLYLSCPAAGGAKFALDVPASATMRASALGHEGGDTGTENTGTGTTDATAFYTRTNDDNFWIGWGTVVNSTNAGNVALQFAQNAASGTSSILVNSMQLALRVA